MDKKQNSLPPQNQNYLAGSQMKHAATQTLPYAFTVRSSFKWHIKKMSSAIEICYTYLKVTYLTKNS